MFRIMGDMPGAIHLYDLVIHERHLDTFGHVNNATYLDLLEEARWDLITRNGFGLDEIKRLQLGPTILEIRPLIPLTPSAGPAAPTDPVPPGVEQ